MKISPILAALSRRLSSIDRTKPPLQDTSLERQEPDPAKEIGRSAREISGWSMGGSSSID